MPTVTGTAWDTLHHGDAIRSRVAKDRSSVAAVAEDAGFALSIASKAAWLAGVYDDTARQRLGRRVLERLTPMHLEVAARVGADQRVALLRRAAQDGLTARHLRVLVRAETDATAAARTPEVLEVSTRAMETYAGFSDTHLRRLIEGPNGLKVRQAAVAGRTLAARIAEFSTI